MSNYAPEVSGWGMVTGSVATVPAGGMLAAQGADSKSPPLQMVVGDRPQLPLTAWIRGLTLDQLSSQLESFERGLYRNVIPMWRKMARRDGHLLSVVGKRLDRIPSDDWEVLPVDDSPEATRQAEFLGAFLEDIENFNGHVEHLAEAIKYKTSGCEIEWLPGQGPAGELRCRLHDLLPEQWDKSTGVLALYPSTQAAQTLAVPADKFIVHELAGALLEASSILYVAKLTTLGQWLGYGSKYGNPGLIGNAPAGASESDRNTFYEMLCHWGERLAAICPEGYTVTPVKAEGAGQVTYPQLVQWADDQNSKIWTGHTVTADAKSGTGTLAGEGGLEQLRDLTKKDVVRLAATLDRDLCTPAVKFQFGAPLLAHVHFKVEDPVDTAAEVQVAKTLVVDMGVPLPKADVYRRFGWRVPEAKEETITRPSSPAPADPLAGLGNQVPGTAFKATDPGALRAAIAGMVERAMPAGRGAIEPMRRQMMDLLSTGVDKGWSIGEFRKMLLAMKVDSSSLESLMKDLMAAGLKAGAQDVSEQTGGRA